MKNILQILQVVKKWSLILVVVGLLFWFFIFNWSFVFKKKVIGEVVAAERVAGLMTIVTNGNEPFNPQAFSFSVAIKDRQTGEIHMASSEDRKWAAVSKGNCVVAAYFPYPPWKIVTKGETDHNARLLKNYMSCADVPPNDSFWDALKFFFLFD